MILAVLRLPACALESARLTHAYFPDLTESIAAAAAKLDAMRSKEAALASEVEQAGATYATMQAAVATTQALGACCSSRTRCTMA